MGPSGCLLVRPAKERSLYFSRYETVPQASVKRKEWDGDLFEKPGRLRYKEDVSCFLSI